MKAKVRMALTADLKRVVPYESGDARYLFAAPGQEIPKALAKKYGIIDGEIPEEDGPQVESTSDEVEDEEKEKVEDEDGKDSEEKAEEKPEDKQKKKPETKPIIKPETKRRSYK